MSEVTKQTRHIFSFFLSLSFESYLPPANIFFTYLLIYLFIANRPASRFLNKDTDWRCCVMALKSRNGRWWVARRIDRQTYIGESLRDCRLGVREPKANTCIRPHHHHHHYTLATNTNPLTLYGQNCTNTSSHS